MPLIPVSELVDWDYFSSQDFTQRVLKLPPGTLCELELSLQVN